MSATATATTWAATHPIGANPTDARGMCLWESNQYAHHLTTDRNDPAVRFVRATGRTYPGREHWAVFLPDHDDPAGSGTVVDLTARQFDPTAPFPWVGDLFDWFDDACEWLRDGLDVDVLTTHTVDGFPGNGTTLDTFDHVRDDVVPA